MFLPSLKSKIIFILLIISSAAIILSVALLIYLFPKFIKDEIHKNVELKQGTEQYDRFIELPFALDFKVYFFNIENPEDIKNGKKPIVKEVGPYVYKEFLKKTIYAINEQDDTISYRQRERFEFNRGNSGNLSDTDEITMLNVPMISVLQTAEKLGQAGTLSTCLNEIFTDINSIFIKVQVKDALFQGIKFCFNRFSLCELRKTIACKIAETKKNVDKLNDSLQFSFFNYKAKTDDGLYTVKRGTQDVQTLGEIVTWNSRKFTNFWTKAGPNSTCDEIKGTDSTLYPPEISKVSVFQIYSTDICTYTEIEFRQEKRYKGIKGYMFTPNNSTFRSKCSNEEEDCFCSQQTKGINGEDTCFLNGVIDMQPCIGAPVLLSFPHFLGADKSYIEGVMGVLPNEEHHNTFVIVEPETGTPLQGMKRIQINAVLRPINKIKKTEKLPRVVVPLLWIEEGFSLNDEYINKLNTMYFDQVAIINILKWALLGGSIMITFICASYFIRGQCLYKP